MDRTTLVDSSLELARIERLLDRLDPNPSTPTPCRGMGCVHTAPASTVSSGILIRAD